MVKYRDFHVRPGCAGITLYHFLKRVLPRKHSSTAAVLIREGAVEVNGVPTSNDMPLKTGDLVSVDTEILEAAAKRPSKHTLEVLFRDEAVICVNKPAGVSVIPDRRQVGKTAVQMLREMLKEEGFNPKPVHRLDKWTSGVLLLALQKEYVEELGRLFAEQKVEKTYYAFVRGRPHPASGTIEEPIGPDSKRMKRMVVGSKQAKPALTHYELKKRWEGFSLLEIKPKTGRTHQIRVHLSHIHHPILCDALYGGGDAFYLSELKINYRLGRGKTEKPLLSRQALHAGAIDFSTPATGQRVRVEAGLPHDLSVLAKKLEQYGEPLR
jgi:RluA family pseudouridine synthase